jgi:cold shock CspA family protein
MSNRDFGTIVHWNASGYGFIRPNGASERDVFFHASEIGDAEPRIGDTVTYEAGQDRLQRPCARQVRFVADDAI